jgi:hypothetical protein
VTIAVGLAAVVVLGAIQVRHRRAVGRERRAVLDEVAPLFDDVEITQDGIGFPSLRGRRNGHTVTVALSVDTLTMRRLPTLWMLVSVLRRLPVRTPIDITLRPRPSDIVSAGLGFRYEHPVPADWPRDIRVATPEPALPPLEALEDFVELLELPTTKGVLIAPGGVRIVHELARGAVGQYRVVRRPKFRFSVDAERLLALIDAAEAIGDRVEASGVRAEARA